MITRKTETVTGNRPAVFGFTSVRGRGAFIERVEYDGNGTLTKETRSHDDIATRKFIGEDPRRAAKLLSVPGVVDSWTQRPSAEGYSSLTQAEADKLTAEWQYMQGVLDIFEETIDGLPPEEQALIAKEMAEWELTPPTGEDFSTEERAAINSASQKNDEERRGASYFAALALEHLPPASQVPQGLGQVAAAGAQAA